MAGGPLIRLPDRTQARPRRLPTGRRDYTTARGGTTPASPTPVRPITS